MDFNHRRIHTSSPKISFDFLHQFFKEHNLIEDVCFIQLKSHYETCIERILNRMVCPGCSMVYNRRFAAPTQTSICNSCNIPLISRTADTEEIAKKRLAFFYSEIEPLLQVAQEFYEVLIIETECSIHNLRDKYEKLVEQSQPTGDI